MHRPTVGLIAFACLATTVWLRFFPLQWEGNDGLLGATMRIGLVMAALWLALPQLQRWPGWLIQVIGVSAVIIAIRPKVALVAIPVLLAYLFLRPKNKSNGPGPGS